MEWNADQCHVRKPGLAIWLRSDSSAQLHGVPNSSESLSASRLGKAAATAIMLVALGCATLMVLVLLSQAPPWS